MAEFGPGNDFTYLMNNMIEEVRRAVLNNRSFGNKQKKDPKLAKQGNCFDYLVNDNMQFECGFYTPGTVKARLIERSKRPVLNNGSSGNEQKPEEPKVVKPVHNGIVISRPQRKDEVKSDPPRVTLARKRGIEIRSSTVSIQCQMEEKERIEIRKRELVIRESVCEDKSENQHRWNMALLKSIESSSVCL